MTEITSYPPGAFCWVELTTSDGNAAKAFYSQMFGWTNNDIPLGEHGVYVMLQKNGRDVGALFENKGAPVRWTSYVAVTSVDDTTKTAKDLGATVVAEPMDVFDSGRMAVLTDPQGATFALWQANQHIGAGVRDEIGTLVWNELSTTDDDAAAKFYSSLFGWSTKKDSGSGMPYTEINVGGRGWGGIYKLTPEMQGMPVQWTPYFHVDDCDAAVAKARSLGANVMMPGKDIPGVGRFAFLLDPQGAMFALIKPMPRE